MTLQRCIAGAPLPRERSINPSLQSHYVTHMGENLLKSNIYHITLNYFFLDK